MFVIIFSCLHTIIFKIEIWINKNIVKMHLKIERKSLKIYLPLILHYLLLTNPHRYRYMSKRDDKNIFGKLTRCALRKTFSCWKWMGSCWEIQCKPSPIKDKNSSEQVKIGISRLFSWNSYIPRFKAKYLCLYASQLDCKNIFWKVKYSFISGYILVDP